MNQIQKRENYIARIINSYIFFFSTMLDTEIETWRFINAEDKIPAKYLYELNSIAFNSNVIFNIKDEDVLGITAHEMFHAYQKRRKEKFKAEHEQDPFNSLDLEAYAFQNYVLSTLFGKTLTFEGASQEIIEIILQKEEVFKKNDKFNKHLASLTKIKSKN